MMELGLISLFLLPFIMEVHGLRCPDDCLCDFEMKIADCSDRFLHQLPNDLDPSVVKLVLKNNYLGDLTSEYFRNQHLTHLTELDLSDNCISVICFNAFLGMDELHHLNMQNNRLKYLLENSFRGLRNLENLFLDNNTILTLYNDVFQDLGNLKLLSLSNNKLEILQPGIFRGLHNLIQLVISSNNIQVLGTGFLYGTEGSLEVLMLGDNTVTEIEDGAFLNLTNLRFLSLMRNRLEVIESCSFNGLVALQYLNIKHNFLEEIKPDTFHNLPKLKSLDLSHNELYSIYPNAFSENKNLQNLYLSQNSLLYIYNEIPFIDVPSLKILKLSGCKVKYLSATTFRNVPNLTALALDDTYLTNVEIEALEHLKELKLLSIHDNPLRCDCSLDKVRRWCHDHNLNTSWYTTDIDVVTIERCLEPTCIFPELDVAMDWSHLKCPT